MPEILKVSWHCVVCPFLEVFLYHCNIQPLTTLFTGTWHASFVGDNVDVPFSQGQVATSSRLAIVPGSFAFVIPYFITFLFHLYSISVLTLSSLFLFFFWIGLVQPPLANTFLLVSIEDANFLVDFVASHEGSILPSTDPPTFKRMAYQAFVEIWRFLASYPLIELLWDRRKLTSHPKNEDDNVDNISSMPKSLIR